MTLRDACLALTKCATCLGPTTTHLAATLLTRSAAPCPTPTSWSTLASGILVQGQETVNWDSVSMAVIAKSGVCSLGQVEILPAGTLLMLCTDARNETKTNLS